jgi:ABC-type uncharacterized transport system substrate-binding protein
MGCATGVVHAAEVVLVFGEGRAGFAETAEALRAELSRSGLPSNEVTRLLSVTSGDGAELVKFQPRLIVTLGADALRQVLDTSVRVPVLATLIPRLTYDHIVREQGRRWASLLSVVYMDQPFSRQLDFLRLALPQARKIGVMWGAESSMQQGALASAASSRQLELVSADAKVDVPLASSLRQALDGSDALLAIADTHVFNANTISNILIGSYRARVPVIAFSPAYVKAGAMAAIYSTPAHIGAQAGVLTKTLLQNSQATYAQYPSDFTISVNERVANSLGFEVDTAALLEKLKKLERKP